MILSPLFFCTKYDVNSRDEKTGFEGRYSDMSHIIGKRSLYIDTV